jgi:DNA polymerase III subunit alpha
MEQFIHLHNHSDFSPQDGAQSTDQIAQKAAEFGMPAVALTDHGRCGGLLSFKKSCTKAKVRPIYGFEAYVAPESRLQKEKLDNHTKTAYHLTLLAKTPEGLRNLFRLTSIGWKEGFYYKPRVDLESLKRHSEGLVVLSGCGSGRLAQMVMAGLDSPVRAHIHEMLDIWGEDFYIEVQNHGFDWQLPLRDALFDIANLFGVPPVVTQDSHYQTRKDADLHRAICKLAAGDLTFEGNDSYFKSYDDICKMFKADQRHAISRTQEVADKCACDWDYGKTIWPVYELPSGETPEQRLRRLTDEGFTKKFGDGTDEYRKRIAYELEVIARMGFPTYFLVVADFINWAKHQGIPVGPGRGSGAGSLVCYCIGITDVEPIKYGLYFERMLNPGRLGSPQIETKELSFDDFIAKLPSLDIDCLED